MALLPNDRKLDEALGAFQSAASLDPDSALPLAGLAEVERRKDFLTDQHSWADKAMASWRQAELRNPDSAEVHRIAGLLEYDRNRPDLALAQMRRATELQPLNGDAFRRLGQLYERAGQFPEALQAYSKARSIAPGDARVYEDLAHIYRQQSNLAEAAKAPQTAVSLAPDRPRYRSLLGAAYQDQGRFNEAEAAKLPDQPAFLWLLLGLANQRTGRAAEARTAFQKGLTVAEQQVVQLPRDGLAHATLAYFRAQTAQPSRAAIKAAQAVQLSPHHNDTL